MHSDRFAWAMGVRADRPKPHPSPSPSGGGLGLYSEKWAGQVMGAHRGSHSPSCRGQVHGQLERSSWTYFTRLGTAISVSRPSDGPLYSTGTGCVLVALRSGQP